MILAIVTLGMLCIGIVVAAWNRNFEAVCYAAAVALWCFIAIGGGVT